MYIVLEKLYDSLEDLREQLSRANIEQDHTQFEHVLMKIASFKRVISYYEKEYHNDTKDA